MVHNIQVRDMNLEDEAHPEQLDMMLDTPDGLHQLRLKRNPNVDMNFDTYSLENGKLKRDASPPIVSNAGFRIGYSSRVLYLKSDNSNDV